MAPISLDQLYMIVEKQDARYAQLQGELEKLKAWSDLNDHYLQEQIDAVSQTLDRLITAIGELHNSDAINERIEELKAEIENLQKEISDLKNTEQLSAEEKRTIGREVKREELYGQQLGMIRSYRMEIRRLKNTVRDLILKCLKLQNQIENFQEHPKEKE